MYFLGLEAEYIIAMLVWLAALAIALVLLVQKRRHWRRNAAAWRMRLVRAGLGLWCLLSFLTGLELSFALLVDETDAFCQTNISRRWFRRHLDAERNAEGFRDRREFEKSVPAGVRRILFLGDSFTIGHGIRRMEDRFTDLMERQLDQQEPGRWQVANLGETGLEVSQIEGMVEATLNSGYQADAIVYVCMINDIEGYDKRTTEVIKQVQATQPQGFLWSRTYFFNWLYFRWRQMKLGVTVDYFPHLASSYEGAPWRGMRSSIIDIHEHCLKHSVPFAIVVFPFLHNLGPEYPFQHAHQLLRELGEEQHFPVLDLEPVLTKQVHEPLTVSRFDNHPNERCHKLAADAIFPWLKESGLLKPGSAGWPESIDRP